MGQKKILKDDPDSYHIWNHKSAMQRPKTGITSTMVSETIPDQTLSIQELVDRFIKGNDIPGLKNFPYDSDQPEEEPLPDIGMMSKTDAAQFKLDVAQTIKQEEQNLIETRKKIAFQKQQFKEAVIAEKAKKQPEKAESKDEKQLK